MRNFRRPPFLVIVSVGLAVAGPASAQGGLAPGAAPGAGLGLAPGGSAGTELPAAPPVVPQAPIEPPPRLGQNVPPAALSPYAVPGVQNGPNGVPGVAGPPVPFVPVVPRRAVPATRVPPEGVTR